MFIYYIEAEYSAYILMNQHTNTPPYKNTPEYTNIHGN